MSVRRDYTQDLFKMLDDLRAQIERPSTFMGVAFGYNKEELAMSVDKVRASIPRELRDANAIARETERMLLDAKQEAEAILAESQREAQRIIEEATAEAERTVEQGRLQHAQLTSEHEVLRMASAQSNEIRQAVERECRELRREADRYSYDVLSRLEVSVGRVLATVERGRQELEQDRSSSPVAEARQEKVKV